MKAVAAYGSWPSPISAVAVAEGSRGLGSLSYDGRHLYWVESRPQEGGPDIDYCFAPERGRRARGDPAATLERQNAGPGIRGAQRAGG